MVPPAANKSSICGQTWPNSGNFLEIRGSLILLDGVPIPPCDGPTTATSKCSNCKTKVIAGSVMIYLSNDTFRWPSRFTRDAAAFGLLNAAVNSKHTTGCATLIWINRKPTSPNSESVHRPSMPAFEMIELGSPSEKFNHASGIPIAGNSYRTRGRLLLPINAHVNPLLSPESRSVIFSSWGPGGGSC